MSKRSKIIAAAVAGVVVVGGGILALTVFKDQIGSKIPIIGEVVKEEKCPLSGREPAKAELIGRPAVAVKVENAEIAYPLSGLEDADVVYEELVEGGITRFMAIYHCTDSDKIGPVRSARVVDPGIVLPFTRILAYAGQNDLVLEVIQDADLVRVEEGNSQGALTRVPREGLATEHTLYADSAKVREVAQDEYEEPPAEDIFKFGEIGDINTKRAKTVDITFSQATQIRYVFEGDAYERFQPLDQPFELEEGGQLSVANVLVQEHEVNNSKNIFDVEGNPSPEIADETGRGRATLFRDGQAIEGTWSRDAIEDPVKFETDDGDEMVFAPGSIWVHLVPGPGGELKGSVSFE